MPDNKVQIILEAADKTKEAFESVKSSSEGLLSSLKSHWLEFAAAGASIYGMIKSIQEFTNAASQAEQIESRMAFQIAAAGINYERVKGTLDAFAASIQNVTRFSSETAQQGLGQMMMYTADLGKALEGTKLAMDMATQTGMDLGSAIKIVGYAMEGNIEMIRVALPQLRQLDTVLGDNATKAEKTAYAMQVLNQMFGGAAQKDVETYAGKMQQFANSLEEVKKGIGEKLLGALEWTKKQEFFQEWWAGVDSLLGITQRATEAQAKLKEGMAAVREESEKAVSIKNLNEFIANWDQWTKTARQTYTVTDELNRAFEQLGIVSTRSMAEAANAALANVERIRKAFEAGKASVNDYKAALAAAATALQKLVPSDTSKAMLELEKEYQRRAKQIREEGGEDFRQKIEALGDWFIAEKNRIKEASVPELEAQVRDLGTRAQSELNKTPMALKLDTADFIEKVKSIISQAQDVANANPITVKMNVESEGGGTGAGWKGLEAPPGWIEEGGTEYNVDFTGSASPQKPLMQTLEDLMGKFKTWQEMVQAIQTNNVTFTGEASAQKPLTQTLEDLMGKFKTWQEMMQAIQTNIQFEELSVSLKKLREQYAITSGLLMEDQRLQVAGGGGPILSFPAAFIRDWKSQMADLESQIKITQMKMTEAILGMFSSDLSGKALEKIMAMIAELVGTSLSGGLYRAEAQMQSFQGGTPYVPATGLYLLHKGEEVRTTNQVSDNRVNNFYISGGSPREIAEEIGKVLKYQRSGTLNDVVKKIRN